MTIPLSRSVLLNDWLLFVYLSALNQNLLLQLCDVREGLLHLFTLPRKKTKQTKLILLYLKKMQHMHRLRSVSLNNLPVDDDDPLPISKRAQLFNLNLECSRVETEIDTLGNSASSPLWFALALGEDFYLFAIHPPRLLLGYRYRASIGSAAGGLYVDHTLHYSDLAFVVQG